MDRYFTIMVVPEREKQVRSFRIPRIVFHGIIFLSVALIALISLLTYDYWKVLTQVYENKHLTIENRGLKEQIQLFQMKINSITEDIERISTFEKKLRIITGLEATDLTQSLRSNQNQNPNQKQEEDNNTWPKRNKAFTSEVIPENYKKEQKFLELKKLYEQKMAAQLGPITNYKFAQNWGELTKQSFMLAEQYAEFDTKFLHTKDFVKNLEIHIHKLDQFLLDQDSFMRSTPTLLPTKGWITSYYGPRMSHYSGRVKMHEGLDIGARPGTPIVAPADGIVTFSGIKPGFGKFVQVDHGYGIETIFAHANSLEIKKGESVKRGDLLATVGNTGYSTGPHVHYEVRVNGTPVDPLYYILD